MIRFENVTKTFPSGTTALQDATFSIAPGELVIMTGPSGSGKTTILRLLLKMIAPTAGNITVDGLDVIKMKNRDLPALRRTIGAVFQDFKVFEDQTVAENINFMFELLGERSKNTVERTRDVLKMVNLPGKEEFFPRQLSGGELQRVAIARALALNPKVLFADEPTGNLDPANARDVAKLFKDINAVGTTVIVATHDPVVVEALHAKTYLLDSGKLTEVQKKK